MHPEERKAYLKHIVDELGGGYIEHFDGEDVFYHVTVEEYEERAEDSTLVPVGEGDE